MSSRKNCKNWGQISKIWKEDSLGVPKISKNLSQKDFLLKFYVGVSVEFGTQCVKFQVKRMSIQLGKNQTVSHINMNLPFGPGNDE